MEDLKKEIGILVAAREIMKKREKHNEAIKGLEDAIINATVEYSAYSENDDNEDLKVAVSAYQQAKMLGGAGRKVGNWLGNESVKRFSHSAVRDNFGEICAMIMKAEEMVRDAVIREAEEIAIQGGAIKRETRNVD